MSLCSQIASLPLYIEPLALKVLIVVQLVGPTPRSSDEDSVITYDEYSMAAGV